MDSKPNDFLHPLVAMKTRLALTQKFPDSHGGIRKVLDRWMDHFKVSFDASSSVYERYR